MLEKADTTSGKNRRVNSNKKIEKFESKTGKHVTKTGAIAVKREVVTYREEQKTASNNHRVNYGNNTAIILCETTDKPENLMTSIEKMDALRIGVSKRDLENLKKTAGLGYDQLAGALSVTRATLINKKRHEKFNAVLSERIISLADIYSYGYKVFEDKERFNQWMFRSNKAFGGQTPFELLDNQFGREEVKNVIGRIEYGVYS